MVPPAAACNDADKMTWSAIDIRRNEPPTISKDKCDPNHQLKDHPRCSCCCILLFPHHHLHHHHHDDAFLLVGKRKANSRLASAFHRQSIAVYEWCRSCRGYSDTMMMFIACCCSLTCGQVFVLFCVCVFVCVCVCVGDGDGDIHRVQRAWCGTHVLVWIRSTDLSFISMMTAKNT